MGAPAKSRRRSGHAFEPRTLNFHKDVFYVEVSLDPSFGPAPDHVPGWAAAKAEAIRFALAVASQI